MKKRGKVEWVKDPGIQKRINFLVSSLKLHWINVESVVAFRSVNSKTRAYARIWGLSRIFQLALDIKPAYVIEVVSEKFDRLSEHEQDKVLIHELVHIPKTFSGSLMPHTRRRRGRSGFEDRVRELVHMYSRQNHENYSSTRRP